MHPLWHNDDAQALAEYAMLLSVVLVVTVLVVSALGHNATTLFSHTAKKLRDVAGTHH